jgi:hypothetical protein
MGCSWACILPDVLWNHSVKFPPSLLDIFCGIALNKHTEWQGIDTGTKLPEHKMSLHLFEFTFMSLSNILSLFHVGHIGFFIKKLLLNERERERDMHTTYYLVCLVEQGPWKWWTMTRNSPQGRQRKKERNFIRTIDCLETSTLLLKNECLTSPWQSCMQTVLRTISKREIVLISFLKQVHHLQRWLLQKGKPVNGCISVIFRQTH